MKILSAAQIREADSYTILHEPISSLDLMERAATAFTGWFHQQFIPSQHKQTLAVICGSGNNGGDGLAIARQLHQTHADNYAISIFIHQLKADLSDDFKANLSLAQAANLDITFLHAEEPLPDFSTFNIVIDALLGTGVNREPVNFTADIIHAINRDAKLVIAVDIPSGVFADKVTEGLSITADYTVTFELPKFAFMFRENEERLGDWVRVDIGLHHDFLRSVATPFYYLSHRYIKSFIKKRSKFAHKGTFGHALLIAGSYGKMGAAVLATRACLRAGAGLVTAHIPERGYEILQISVPEAMVSIDEDRESFTRIEGFERYDAIGVGCGISTRNRTRNALCYVMKYTTNPMVLDADALNILAANPEWYALIPKNSILTPHPKEFERLFGTTVDSFDRNELQREKAQELGVYIVLKGAHTAIACPDGSCYFNCTGNPGMGTAGSGDVLTGIITALLAQDYSPKEAAILGVYWHGLSGDLAAQSKGEASLIAGDLIRFLGQSWQMIEK